MAVSRASGPSPDEALMSRRAVKATAGVAGAHMLEVSAAPALGSHHSDTA